MKDYHFEKDDAHLDQTIRLDEISEKIKELKKTDIEDELGDANAFLDAFESEKFEAAEKMENIPVIPEAEEDAEEIADTQVTPAAIFPPQPPKTDQPPEAAEPEDGLSKRTIGLLALLGVLACILGFSLVRCGFQPASSGKTSQADPLLVEGVLDTDELVVYDILQDTRKTILLTEKTKLLHGADGKENAIGSVEAGDLLMAELAEDGKTALSLDYEAAALQKKEVSGLTVDTDAKKLLGEEDSFAYSERAMFLYHGDKIQPAEIMEMDRLFLQGYAGEIWSVEVLEYHGYLLAENGENIKNGTLQIDEEDAVSLESRKRIPIRTGNHTLLIKGDNIETRKDSISIREGEELRYDLSKAQEKMGVILIDANVSEYRLYINGEQMESPAVLPVGEYDLVILKNGYMDWNDHVELRGDTLTVKAELEQEFQYGTLTVTADCDGARVYINGEASGVAPMQINLPYDSYTVRVEKEGYPSFEQTVQIDTATEFLHAQMQ